MLYAAYDDVGGITLHAPPLELYAQFRTTCDATNPLGAFSMDFPAPRSDKEVAMKWRF